MLQNREETSIVPVATFQAHKDYLTRVLLSPDVKHLATCSADHTAKVWSLDPNYGPAKAAAEARSAIEEETDKISQQPGGRLVPPKPSPSLHGEHIGDGSANSIELVKPQEEDENTPGNEWGAGNAEFPGLPDGPPMDHTTNTLYLETTLANHQRWVWDCAFSADSAYLVTVSSDHYARLWELSSGQIIRQYSGHHRGSVCVALNDYSEPR